MKEYIAPEKKIHNFNWFMYTLIKSKKIKTKMNKTLDNCLGIAYMCI